MNKQCRGSHGAPPHGVAGKMMLLCSACALQLGGVPSQRSPVLAMQSLPRMVVTAKASENTAALPLPVSLLQLFFRQGSRASFPGRMREIARTYFCYGDKGNSNSKQRVIGTQFPSTSQNFHLQITCHSQRSKENPVHVQVDVCQNMWGKGTCKIKRKRCHIS